MAKKNKNVQVANSVSKFNGGLLSLIGCVIVMFLVAAIMIGVGAYLASMNVIGNGTPWQEDIATPTVIALLIAGALFAAIGVCWAEIKLIKWETKHTIISGIKFKFNGNALQLFGNIVKWTILTVITIGIYGLWLPIKVRQWRVKHTTCKEDDYAYAPQITFTTY